MGGCLHEGKERITRSHVRHHVSGTTCPCTPGSAIPVSMYDACSSNDHQVPQHKSPQLTNACDCSRSLLFLMPLMMRRLPHSSENVRPASVHDMERGRPPPFEYTSKFILARESSCRRYLWTTKATRHRRHTVPEPSRAEPSTSEPRVPVCKSPARDSNLGTPKGAATPKKGSARWKCPHR